MIIKNVRLPNGLKGVKIQDYFNTGHGVEEFSKLGMSAVKLRIMQKLPLDKKIVMSTIAIRNWYESFEGKVYIAFSGGKDSTVLLHLVRSMFPDVKAVFSHTGLEYPEVVAFAKRHDNVTVVHPKITFKQVLDQYGYPVISRKVSHKIRVIREAPLSSKLRTYYLTGVTGDKRLSLFGKLPDKWKFLIDAPFKISEHCCTYLKKEPMKRYGHESGEVPIIGVMATDGYYRRLGYLKKGGCNNYDTLSSTPLGFWTSKDIYAYIEKFKLEIAPVYFGPYALKNTGCIFCGFGVHLDKGLNRFQRMQLSHAKLHEYCMHGLKMEEVLKYLKIPHLGKGHTFW